MLVRLGEDGAVVMVGSCRSGTLEGFESEALLLLLLQLQLVLLQLEQLLVLLTVGGKKGFVSSTTALSTSSKLRSVGGAGGLGRERRAPRGRWHGAERGLSSWGYGGGEEGELD